MAVTSVLSDGPVSVNDPASGKQYSIPLTALYFKDGVVKADKWPSYPKDPKLAKPIDDWLNYLAKQNLLVSGDAPAPRPAFQIKARDPGSMGNFITVEFKNVKPADTPGDTKADVTVTETDTYTRLTPSTLAATLGTNAGAGQRPGLVFLASANPVFPAADEGNLSSTSPYTLDVKATVGTAFTVQGKRDEADAKLTHVQVKEIDAAANTFTLVAKWTKTQNVKLSELDTVFGYVIQVDLPADVPPPAPGIVALNGGSDPLSAAPSQATVLSGP